MWGKKVSVIGLGKLGSPMVAAFASKGCEVIGVDLNSDFVKCINEGKPPVIETNLEQMLAENQQNYSATQDYEKAIMETDITFIVVPTPSGDDGIFLTKYAVSACENIGKALKNKSEYHLVVLTSTVCPGYTEKDLLPVLEKHSEKKCGKDFGLCYNPEFIALGDVINGILRPDFVLIGECDENSGKLLSGFYERVCKENTPIKRMEIVNAEITKIALNTFVTTKISYANMLSELCENVPGGNIDVVTNALGEDERIGSKYIKGGLGYGGPCFPRDNRALVSFAKKHNVSLPIAVATDEINKNQIARLEKLVMGNLTKNGSVGILGLSYKPTTNVVEESHGLRLAQILAEQKINVVVYDPEAMGNAKTVLSDSVGYASSAEECIESVDIVVIAMNWKEFSSLDEKIFKSSDESSRKTIIDCWRILDRSKYEVYTNYLALGVNRGKTTFADTHTKGTLKNNEAQEKYLATKI